MGAVLSSWVYFQQQKASKPRIYIRLDSEIKGTNTAGERVGDLVVFFSNVGGSTVSIAPHVRVLTADSRTGELVDVPLSFIRGENSLKIPGRSDIPSTPATLNAGGEAVAKSVPFVIKDESFESLDYYVVYFQLSDGKKFKVFFGQPEYLKYKQGTEEIYGWSSGSLAQEMGG